MEKLMKVSVYYRQATPSLKNPRLKNPLFQQPLSDEPRIYNFYSNIEKIELDNGYFLLFEPGTDSSTCIHLLAKDFFLDVSV